MKRNLSVLFALLLLASCVGKRGGAADNGANADPLASKEITFPFTIDVSRNYPMEPVSFQEVLGELEYVALETTPECLIPDLPGLQSPVVTDSDIFICSGPNIFHFGRDGKFLNRIGHEGRGPGEYLSATEMCVNDATEEVFVYDVLSKGILVYGYDGRHKRTLRTNANSMIGDMIPASDTTLLIANAHDFERSPVDAFQLISSRDGRVVKSLMPPHEDPNMFVQTDMAPPQRGTVSYPSIPETENDPAKRYKEAAGGIGLRLRYDTSFGELSETHNIYVTEAGVELTSFVMDTVYVASGTGKLAPRWIKTPSPMKLDVPRRRYSRFGFEAGRYAFFYALGSGDRSAYKVDKSNGTITRTYLYDANLDREQTPDNRIIFPTAINTGRLAMPYQPHELLRWLEEGKLSGELAALAATLKEDDTPVLMIQKN